MSQKSFFSARQLSLMTMRPCNKAPSKSTAAASPAASPGSAQRSTRLASTVAASPAASPGSARRSTHLSSRLYGTEQSPSVSILESTTFRDVDTTSNKAFQADAAHMQFGKYTLFSSYGTTAERLMSPVAFGIMFGNENKESWGHFGALL